MEEIRRDRNQRLEILSDKEKRTQATNALNTVEAAPKGENIENINDASLVIQWDKHDEMLKPRGELRQHRTDINHAGWTKDKHDAETFRRKLKSFLERTESLFL